ncbi:50S ribosomal protein L16 [Candidatus Pacearchaeota archaeon ex4484_26]|nr:MAG: 50S ribosomal protein L16 [Candidatus Pacearchaeota archaeon ex4484_26]
MALRKAIAYRYFERPNTRKSKVKSKSYIKTIPGSKIVKFRMGNKSKKFPFKLSLVSKEAVQMRDTAIEASRQTINRLLEKKLGRNNYYFVIRVYPHHILRENKMLTGAGADRMQSGMKKSFGKPVGIAARVHVGDELFSIDVEKSGLAVVKEAFRRIKAKIPCTTSIVIEKVSY